MISSKQTQLNKTTNNRYWLFLFSFFTLIFPQTIKAQGPQPLLGFDCFFANNDGPYVYPCASQVTAIITIPNGVPMNTVSLTFPNSFEIIDVSPNIIAPQAGGVNPQGGSIITQDFYTNGVTTMQITFAYRNCNVYYPGLPINTTSLYFDCDGWVGNGGTAIQYLANLVLPNQNDPGLNHEITNVLARANMTAPPLPAIQIVATPNGVPPLLPLDNNVDHTDYSGVTYDRYFDIIINSSSISEFDLKIDHEINVIENSLKFVHPTDIYNVGPDLTINALPAAYGEFHISLDAAIANQVPLNFIAGTGNLRRVRMRQSVTLNCIDVGSANVTAKLNCGSNCPAPFTATTSPVFALDGKIHNVTDITFTESTLINTTVNQASNAACSGNYIYTLSFGLNQKVSKLDKIIIPLNTQSFAVDGIWIGNALNNLSSYFLVDNLIISTTNNSPNSPLTINVDQLILANSNLNWPGFDYDFNQNLGYPNGAWIDALNSNTLVVKIKLHSIIPNPPVCTDLRTILTPIPNNPANQIRFIMLNTCDGSNSFTDYITPSVVATPIMPVAQINNFYASPPSLSVPMVNPITFTCQLTVPTESPFQIDAVSPNAIPIVSNQINCTNTIYRVILSVDPTPSFSAIGTIAPFQIMLNGTSYTITPILNSNTLSFDLPEDPNSNLSEHVFDFHFDITGIGCPNDNVGGGDLIYRIKLLAICDDCPTNPTATIRNLACDDASLVIHCDGLCVRQIDTHDDLTINRTTFGWEDLASSYSPGLAIPNPSAFENLYTNPPYNQDQYTIQTQLRKLYPFDNFTLHVTGNVKPLTVPFLHNGVSFEINYPSSLSGLPADFFQFISCTAKFTPASNNWPIGPDITVNFPPSFSSPVVPATPPNPLPANFNMRDLFWASNLLLNNNNPININAQEYNIDITINFTISATAPVVNIDPEFHCLFKTFTDDLTDPEQRSCDLRSEIIHVYIPGVELKQCSVSSGNITLPCGSSHLVGVTANPPVLCQFSHAIGIKHTGVVANFLDIRPLTKWPKKITDPNSNLISIDDLYAPGTQSYTTSDPFKNSNPNELLLPMLEGGDIPANSFQGLILTLNKNCPNSTAINNFPLAMDPLQVTSPFAINRYAYVHWTIPNNLTMPTLIADPINTPNLSSNTLNTICSLDGFPDAVGTVTIPNSSYDYHFSLPIDAQGMPIALEITASTAGILPPNLLGNLEYQSTGILITPTSPSSNIYYFNSGVSSLDLNLPLDLTTPTDPNGCFMTPFTITFTWHVMCGNQVTPPINTCLNCSTQVSFQRGMTVLTAADVDNHFEQTNCGIKWILNLNNPSSQSAITYSNLDLIINTGMIYQSGVWYTTSTSGTPVNLSPVFTFNPPFGNLSFSSAQTLINLGQINLLPGETLTYELIFKLACGNTFTPGSLIFNASLEGDNICDDQNSFSIPNIPIEIAPPYDPTPYITAASAVGCCEEDPSVTIVHACGAPPTGGVITIANPNNPLSNIIATLYYPVALGIAPYTQTSNAANIEFNSSNTLTNMGPGVYSLTIFNPTNGSYFTQDVVIEDYSFTVSINPTSPAMCSGGSTLLEAVPVSTQQPPIPIANFNFTYQWYYNNSIIPLANLQTYLATNGGNYSVIVSDAQNCTAIAYTNVLVNPPLTISGDLNACSTTAEYEIPAYFPQNAIEAWAINGIPVQNSQGLYSLTVDWGTVNGFFGGTITVHTEEICGGTKEIHFHVLPCCTALTELNIDQVTDLNVTNPVNANISGNVYTITGQTFVLNPANTGSFFQALDCDAEIVLNDCNIAMGDEVEFRLRNSIHLTINNTTIKSCVNRHNGIDAMQGGNVVTIYNDLGNPAVIQDANIGVRILNGTLKSTNGNFDNNVEHIYAERSTVNITGGNYLFTGPMLPPYTSVLLPPSNSVSFVPFSANASPRTAIRLLNCVVLPEIREININKAGTGVEVRGGGLIFKSNKVSNCKKGVYHWNTINSTQNSNAECNIGDWGGTSNDINQFENCAEGIFAGGKLIPCHINGNYISNSSGFGIKVQWLRKRGFTVNGNTLTNCQFGIYSYENDTKGNLIGSPTIKEINLNVIKKVPNNPISSKGIIVEEATVASLNYPNIHLDIVGNELAFYRYGISLTNCAYPLIKENKVYVNSYLLGIDVQSPSLTDFATGIQVSNCPHSAIIENKVSSSAPFPDTSPEAHRLISGIKVSLSQNCFICGNIASETGTYPGSISPMQIGTPFEFYSNCMSTRFRLNTMNNSTSRGLYLAGGMLPMPGSNPNNNGTIIGVQGNSNDDASDNTWGNMISGYYTDFNNVAGDLNKFWMTYSPVSWPAILPNSSPNKFEPPFTTYEFKNDHSNGVVYLCNSSSNPSPIVQQRILDDYDDIARDSISKLGGNDTTRYFGKEFLYAQMKSDSTLAAYSILAQFKDSMDLTNTKYIDDIKHSLILPIDSSLIDSLNILLSMILPGNNIEENFKNVFELVLKNPEQKDSVYNLADYVRLRNIAKMCPFIEGTAVYTARVILHAFEPDSNYYNYCEFAKTTNRISNERNSNIQEIISKENTFANDLEYKVIPNPNNGTFELLTNSNDIITCEISDMAGRIFENGNYKPIGNKIQFGLSNLTKGIYHLKVIDLSRVTTFKIVIN
jgi:hypothetical protein